MIEVNDIMIGEMGWEELVGYLSKRPVVCKFRREIKQEQEGLDGSLVSGTDLPFLPIIEYVACIKWNFTFLIDVGVTRYQMHKEFLEWLLHFAFLGHFKEVFWYED